MKYRVLKYLTIFLLPIAVAISFTSKGLLAYMPILFSFVLIPFIELFIKPDASNLSDAELEMIREDRLYDYILYALVPILYAFLIWFMFSIQEDGLTIADKIGRLTGMGILLGAMGINVAHELGHRRSRLEQTLSKLLLLPAQYMHFYVEHNQGHHKNVSTDEDPASAKYKESLYIFWFRSIIFSYLSAWNIENKRLKRKNSAVFSFNNQMLNFLLLQVGFIAIVGLVFDVEVMLYYCAAFVFAILLLETVNYVEHYGLRRKKLSENRYENAQPIHSWNSNHVIGRLILFELSRHSDHHYNPYKKYQTLSNHNDNPQLPTGYPGMMLLSMIPPLWFLIMNKKIKTLNAIHNS